MDDDQEEIEVPITNELEQRIAEAFEVFDQYRTKTIERKDASAIIRGLGCCPTETELQEIILGIDDAQFPGVLHLVNFLPKVSQFITEHKYEPPSPESLLKAFRSLDPKGLGYLTVEDMTNLMTTNGEPLTQDELEEMFEMAIDPLTKTIQYEYYINQLMHEPEGEQNIYAVADRIEAEKPPPPPPPKRMSEYLREVAEQIE